MTRFTRSPICLLDRPESAKKPKTLSSILQPLSCQLLFRGMYSSLSLPLLFSPFMLSHPPPTSLCVYLLLSLWGFYLFNTKSASRGHAEKHRKAVESGQLTIELAVPTRKKIVKTLILISFKVNPNFMRSDVTKSLVQFDHSKPSLHLYNLQKDYQTVNSSVLIKVSSL